MSKWNQQTPPKPERELSSEPAPSGVVDRRERIGEWAAQFTAALLIAGRITPSALCSTALNYALELERLVSRTDLPDL
jgi:hypothetical protein